MSYTKKNIICVDGFDEYKIFSTLDYTLSTTDAFVYQNEINVFQ